jgi:hypothetical protein
LKGLAGVATDGETLEQHKGSINGHDAVWVVWKGKLKNGDALLEVQDFIFATIVDKTAFVVTCSAQPGQYDGLKDAFEGICGTFKVTP